MAQPIYYYDHSTHKLEETFSSRYSTLVAVVLFAGLFAGTIVAMMIIPDVLYFKIMKVCGTIIFVAGALFCVGALYAMIHLAIFKR